MATKVTKKATKENTSLASAEKVVKSAAKKTPNAKKLEKAKLSARKIAAKTKVVMTRSMTRANAALAAGKTKKKSDTSRMKVKPLGHAPHSARISTPKGELQKVASKTTFAPKYNEDRQWLIVDVADQTVGRVASEIANLLRGKHKATFTPNNDAGDFIVVINAEKIKFTSTKEDKKEYFRHSGWIGGLKITTPARLRTTHPERILENAVRGMVARTPLGRDQMRKLKIYVGDQHPHAAQSPVVWKLRNKNTTVQE